MDAATSLLTYTQIQHALRIEFGRARRHSLPLSCLAIAIDGIDHLRAVHGGAARDDVIVRTVRRLQPQVRLSDVVGHYQDHLVVLLPHSGIEGARAVAERFLVAVRSEPFPVAWTPQQLTASVGVAAFERQATIFYDSVLKSAESALAQAVAAGGDQVVVASGNSPAQS